MKFKSTSQPVILRPVFQAWPKNLTRSFAPAGLRMTLLWAFFSLLSGFNIQTAHAGTGSGSTSNTTFTTSTTHHSIFNRVDLPDERLDTFLTRLTGRIDAGPILADFSFDKPFADPIVQAAINTVKNNLSALAAPDPLSFTGPSLLSSMNSLFGSSTDFLGNQINHDEQTVTTTASLGPGTILIGDDQSQTFFVQAGTTNYNTNTHTESFFDQVYQTTNTFKLKEHYEIVGNTAVPEPTTGLLFAFGLGGMGLIKRKRFLRWRDDREERDS